MGFLLILVLAGLVALLVQVAQLRTESRSLSKQAIGEINRIAAESLRIRILLAEVTTALEAAPAAAKSLSAPDSLPGLTRGLKEIAEQFGSTRDEIKHSATAVCDALEQATQAHLEAVEEFEVRGDRLVANVVRASGEMGRVAAELRSTTEASSALHEALRSNAVSFQMVQDLIEKHGDLLPQVAASTQSLSRLIERVEEKNLFSEAVFSHFEGALEQLSNAVVDFVALSRTLASQLDQQPQRVTLVPTADVGSRETAPS